MIQQLKQKVQLTIMVSQTISCSGGTVVEFNVGPNQSMQIQSSNLENHDRSRYIKSALATVDNANSKYKLMQHGFANMLLHKDNHTISPCAYKSKEYICHL